MLTDPQLTRLTDVFRTLFNRPELELREAMTAADVPGWDSFNHVNLVIAIEEEFQVRFTTEEISNWRTVGEMMHTLATKLGPA
jgi:acyl carrier protein